MTEAPRAICWPPPREATLVAPHEAYNVYVYNSTLVIDCCSRQCEEEDADPGDVRLGVMPGSAWLGPIAARPLAEAAAAARGFLVDELKPDDASTALVLHDDVMRAQSLAAWLYGTAGCERVLAVERDALRRDHAFLLRPGASELRLPNEIVPGRLYLGPASTNNATAIELLGITHVVSLLERRIMPSHARSHLVVRVADRANADLDSALREALPFIASALRQPGGRVLVHCEAGASRSGSAVTAALVAYPSLLGVPRMGVDAALAFVKAQRPAVRPNYGFLEKLRAKAWLDTSPWRDAPLTIRALSRDSGRGRDD